MDKNYQKYLSITAGIMLLLAIPAIWPYGYFQILRWIVAGVAVYNAYFAYELKKNEWVLIMIAVAILFNPIAPIFLQKETWVILDLVASVLMFVSIIKLKTKKS
ncbi:MAG: hypothetical protein Q7K40_04325 [bacterium]|nr:hypothetical protein [bacterium]